MKIHFLSGTDSGNAHMLAEDLETEFSAEFECSVTSLEDISPTDLSTDGLNVIVCSTTGSGDVPGTAESFYAALQSEKPDLSQVAFAVFGLGDRTYDSTFNQGSEKLMTALIDCGAKMVGERGLHDNSDAEMPEDIAFPWFRALPLGVTA